MNVRELIDALEDFGDHVPVKVVVVGDENDRALDFEFSDGKHDGAPAVLLEVDL